MESCGKRARPRRAVAPWVDDLGASDQLRGDLGLKVTLAQGFPKATSADADAQTCKAGHRECVCECPSSYRTDPAQGRRERMQEKADVWNPAGAIGVNPPPASKPRNSSRP
eukprot:4293863-Alexandrium_andersonii.AAC.1